MKKWFYRFRSSDFYVTIQLKLEDFINYLKELDISKVGTFFNSLMLVISPFFIRFDRFLKKSKYIKAFNYTTYQKEIEKDIKDTDEYTEKRMNGVYEHLKYTKIALVVIPILSFVIRLGGQGAASLSFKVLMLEIVAIIYLYYLKRKIDKYEFGEIILEEYLNTLFNYLSLRMDLKSAINVVSEFKNSIDRLEKEKKDKDFVLSEIDKTNLLITEDKQLGTIITLKTIEHSKEVKNSNDSTLAKYSILAQLDDNTEKAYYIKDNQVKIMLDDFMFRVADSNREYHNIVLMKDYYENLDNAYYFEDLFKIKEYKEMKSKGFNDTDIRIINYLRTDLKKDIGIFFRNSFDKAVTKKEFSMTVRVELFKPVGEVEKNLGKIGVATGYKPTILKGEKDNFVYLKFKTTNKKPIGNLNYKYKDLKELSKENKIDLGATENGNYVVQIKDIDELVATLIAGYSGSGKSVFARRFIASFLESEKYLGNHTVAETFIISTKLHEDFTPLGWGVKNGMFTTEDHIEHYFTLKKIMQISQERSNYFKQFDGVTSIKDFNEKVISGEINEPYLGNILLVEDEFVNGLQEADMITNIEIDGKKIKNLGAAIRGMIVNIAQKGRTRGIALICITQDFRKNENALGSLSNIFNTSILGFAQDKIWRNIEPEIADYFENERNTIGTFFVQNKALKNVSENKDDIEQEAMSGYIKVHTHMIEEDEKLYPSFNRTFETYSKYGQDIINQAKIVKIENDLLDEFEDVEEDTQEKVIKLDTESNNKDNSDDDDIFSNLI